MSAVAKATAAWGELPDWVEALALECDRVGQRGAALIIGYSASAVNMVLQNKYGRDGKSARGDSAAVELAVRGTILKQDVSCPILGDIPADRCKDNQQAPWAPHNPQRIALYRACRSCPQSRKNANDPRK